MEQKLPVKAPEKTTENLLNSVCIIPFEATLLYLYNHDKDALEELMRALIHLDSINVHLFIYTTEATKEEVLKLLKEYGPSKYFIGENDIFCLATMQELPEDMTMVDKEYHLINICINTHNRTRPDAIITPDLFQERVLILHPDPTFFEAIDNKKEELHYMRIHIDMSRVYVELLEKIFIIFRENGRAAKIQEASDLFRIAKDQNAEVLNDQKMMGLHYQVKQLKIAESIVDGMAKFLKRLSKVLQFIKAFQLLSRSQQAELLQNLQKNLEARIRDEPNVTADLIEEKIKELCAKLPELRFSYGFADLNHFQLLSTELWYSLRDELENQLEEPLTRLRKSKITYNELKPEILSSLCVEELNDNQKSIIAAYGEELERAPQQAQKHESGEYYWLYIVGTKKEKEQKSILAKDIYVTELFKQLQAEMGFLQMTHTFEYLNEHYNTTAQKIAAEVENVGFMLGNREQELSEERNRKYIKADTIKNEALFESMFIAVKNKRHSRLSMVRVVEDPFQLCRSGNVAGFIKEVLRQQSEPYSHADIMLMLNIKTDLKQGCEHLLRGKDGGGFPDHDNYKYYVLIASGIDSITANNNKVFAEIKPLINHSQQELRIKILFPHCLGQNENYWTAGEIKIFKLNHQYLVNIILHDACGGGKLNVEEYQRWLVGIEKQIKQIDAAATIQMRCINSPYAPRLHENDRLQSGVVVVQDIIQRVLGAALTLQQKSGSVAPPKKILYPRGMHEIRALHIKELLNCTNKKDVKRQIFLKHHPDPNQVGDHKKTYVETAAQHGQVKMLQFLLDEIYADVNFSESGFHPIFSALLGIQSYPSRIDCLRLILQGGSEFSDNKSRRAVLNQKTVDVAGTPLLHFAMALGIDRGVEVLVRWGVDNPGAVPLYSRNKQNRTALYEALCVSKYGKLRGVVEVLLSGGLGLTAEEVDKTRTDSQVKSDMIKVVIGFLDNQLKLLHNLPTSSTVTRNRSGSFGAVFSNMMRSVNYQWKSPIAQLCAENKTDKLLKSQAKLQSNDTTHLNADDEQGFRPIIPVCVCGKIETLDFLLKYEVDVNVVTINKINRKVVGSDDAPELEIATHLSPLHYAVLCQKDSHLFVKKLLVKYADIIADSTQCTPLYYAVGRNSESVRLLLEYLSDRKQLEIARISDKKGITPFVKAVLTADKTCISHFIHFGYWPSNNEISLIELEMVKKENCAEIKIVFCEVMELLKSRLMAAISKELNSSQTRLKPKALNLEPPRLQRSNSTPTPLVRPSASPRMPEASPRKGSDITLQNKAKEAVSVASPRSGSDIVTSPRINQEKTNIASPRSIADSVASPRNDAGKINSASPLKVSEAVNSASEFNSSTKVISPRNDSGAAMQGSLRTGGLFTPTAALNNPESTRTFSPRNFVTDKVSPQELPESQAPVSSPKSAEAIVNNSLRHGGEIVSKASLRPPRGN